MYFLTPLPFSPSPPTLISLQAHSLLVNLKQNSRNLKCQKRQQTDSPNGQLLKSTKTSKTENIFKTVEKGGVALYLVMCLAMCVFEIAVFEIAVLIPLQNRCLGNQSYVWHLHYSKTNHLPPKMSGRTLQCPISPVGTGLESLFSFFFVCIFRTVFALANSSLHMIKFGFEALC